MLKIKKMVMGSAQKPFEGYLIINLIKLSVIEQADLTLQFFMTKIINE
jgi:hypothetical protein